MLDFFIKNFKYFLIILIAFFGCLVLFTFVKIIVTNSKYNKKTRLIVSGTDSNTKVKGIKNNKTKVKKVKTKQNAFVKLYKEYIFFDGKRSGFIKGIVVGYLIFFLIFYILSQSIPVAAVFAIAYLDLFYLYVDKRNEKNRKRYIKGFSLALRTLTASVEAGNSFEEALSIITKRDSIEPKIRSEFAYLSNNLKSNKGLEEALEEFWKRNDLFPEFSMFVIVMQFYSKKGGEGLGKILLDLEKTLENKVESYAEIDTELGIHKTLMNGLIYVYFIFLFLVKLFMPAFYIDIVNDKLGILKVAGSVGLVFFSTIFFKNMVRSAAEG